jgi:CheY-like chemotaxis protein
MDVASLSLMGVNVVVAGMSLFAAEATKACAKPTVQYAFEKLRGKVRSILERLNLPLSEIDADLLRDERIGSDIEVAQIAEELIGNYPSIRRARIVARFLEGAKILWVDDHPGNNRNEVRVLEELGIKIDQARSTTEAQNRLLGRSFDLILSDMDRDGDNNASMELLRALRSAGCPITLVFYVGRVDPTRGVSVGAFGITDQPEPLLHLVLDVLERQRI